MWHLEKGGGRHEWVWKRGHGVKKETVSDILLISTSLRGWTRWDEMPLRWKSALHRYTDVKNMPLWLFGRNSQMSTYVSLTQESCCCEKKPFSHPGTLQGYQIKCCHIYTCLEGAGLFFLKAGWRQQQLKTFQKEGDVQVILWQIASPR